MPSDNLSRAFAGTEHGSVRTVEMAAAGRTSFRGGKTRRLPGACWAWSFAATFYVIDEATNRVKCLKCGLLCGGGFPASLLADTYVVGRTGAE